MLSKWLWTMSGLLVAASTAFGVTLDATSYGAIPSGETDASSAIQSALDDCAAQGGGTVKLPAGRYRLDAPITIPGGVTLVGDWAIPHHAQLQKGTVILVYAGKGQENGPPLVMLQGSSGIKGVTFFYPEQRIPGTQPYPWTIQGQGMHGSVVDVTLVNPYKGINFGEYPNELHYIRNVYGCPLKVGISIDQCGDIGRIENVHFNPHYWGRAKVEGVPKWNDLTTYLSRNCTAFEFGRADWEYVLNTFSYGCKIGMRFYNSAKGACNGNFLGNGIDMAETPILVEQTQSPGVLFTNGEFVGSPSSPAQIEVVSSNSGVFQLSNCSFWGPALRIARIAGTGSVSFCQCNFLTWDPTRKGTPAIEALGGSLTVQSCRFGRDAKQVLLGSGVKTAVIMGNTMVGPIAIENKSKGDVAITANVTVSKTK